ncbi:hypothetical protein [Streptomyces ochraceiscleroticus]|uniref:Immunity protein 30 domain-containing protein n=1 Tax=Streptomyces ochraceiscleroticus TaxID=47761 RepID=A0ABW1MT51_9ACTN|nr:hypothetical protein [Streptomyces ochraceiscleroticus]
MVAVTREAAGELTRQCSTDTPTLSTLLFALRRSLAYDEINAEKLYDGLNAVLDEYARPAPDEIKNITEQLQQLTPPLVQAIPYLVTQYPTNEVRRLIVLSTQRPCPEQAYRHLVRYAMTLDELLGLIGDAAS